MMFDRALHMVVHFENSTGSSVVKKLELFKKIVEFIGRCAEENTNVTDGIFYERRTFQMTR